MMTRLRHNPFLWALVFMLSVAALLITLVSAAIAPGKDVARTCAMAGQPFDSEYRSQNWMEPGQFFPKHNKCNANYDLIPPWINPALVIFAFLALACLTMIVVSLVQQAKARRAESRNNENS